MNHSLQWDIFCKVIDNHGDIGVCWRLSAELASRGQRVRLWVDDASALSWMAPQSCDGVTVLPWLEPLGMNILRLGSTPCEVLVEAFGCEIAPEFIAACVDNAVDTGQKPVWINLEYLSAEAYVERCHAMPSPVHSGPAAGWIKWFFYPGFTPGTGGLLREDGLAARQAAFQRSAWLAQQGIAYKGEMLVSLFCYEPPALARLLDHLAQRNPHPGPVRLLVTAGRAASAVKALINDKKWPQPGQSGYGMLSISYLPLLSQTDFDHLLWTCDLNFVRGEDSVVRAIWAAQAFVWQIYPQADQAHRVKLEAFLDMLQAPPSLRRFHEAWNGLRDELPAPDPESWSACVRTARQRLLDQDELCTQLLGFVMHNRQQTP
jgi:uncharacterized repeat protein (TIGR03837 family)